MDDSTTTTGPTRDRLAASRQRLVGAIARRHRTPGVDFDDLVQMGNLGLIRAIEKAVPAREVAFDSYARPWIRGAILKGLADPANRPGPTLSVCGDGLGAWLPDPGPSPADEAEWRDEAVAGRRRVAAALASLDPEGRACVAMHFGLSGSSPLPVHEIARRRGTSWRAVERTLSRSLAALRAASPET